MLKNIDKNITENEIAIVFRLFDKNKDGSISFNEF
jgi:Ca2+-binding EF-hand superfamily protein